MYNEMFNTAEYNPIMTGIMPTMFLRLATAVNKMHVKIMTHFKQCLTSLVQLKWFQKLESHRLSFDVVLLTEAVSTVLQLSCIQLLMFTVFVLKSLCLVCSLLRDEFIHHICGYCVV